MNLKVALKNRVEQASSLLFPGFQPAWPLRGLEARGAGRMPALLFMRAGKFLSWGKIISLLFLCGALTAHADKTNNKTNYLASFANFDRDAKAGKALTVVFFGGSHAAGIGASDPEHTSYRALLENYLREKYPKAQWTFHYAAVAGTGSALGMFRVEPDVLSLRPHLVFLDFTIDDGLEKTDRQTLASYEVILRDLISDGIPVVEILLGTADQFGPDWKHLGPTRMRDHLQLGNLYHTGVGNSFPVVQDFFRNALRRRDQIWPGGKAAPNDLGHRFFFEAARDGLEQAIAEKRQPILPPAPVFADEYKKRFQFFPATVPLPDGWRVETAMDGTNQVAVGEVAEGGDIAPLQLNFTGTFVGILGETDADAFGFNVFIDGRQVRFSTEEEEVWPTRNNESGGKFFWHTISDSLTPARHTIQIKPATDMGVERSKVRIISIAVAGPAADSAQSISAAAGN